MPDPIVIDKPHARRFLLAHLHLLPPRRLRGKQGVLDYVRHVNCIQYDPINVVGKNPHLVLQFRVRGYKPSMLSALEECLSAFGHYLEAVEIRIGGEVRGQPGLKKAVKEANCA